MNYQEIERKYLVKDQSFREMATAALPIRQGYVCRDQMHTVRARIKGDKGFLTIKGKSQDQGLSRFEWEKELTVPEAQVLLDRCQLGKVEKMRYLIPWQGLTVEVDVFEGANQGLVMAEIEFPSKDYVLPELPAFLGAEVTGDPRFYNSYLAQHPFTTWIE